MSIRIHRSIIAHTFEVKLAIELGLEETCILQNISRIPDTPYDNFHTYFPYIPKDRFYKHLKKLEKKGLLVVEESND